MSTTRKQTRQQARFSKSSQNLYECPAALASELNSLKASSPTYIRQTSPSFQEKRKKSLGITTGKLKRQILRFMQALNPVDQPLQKNEVRITRLNAEQRVSKCKSLGSLN